MLGMLHQRKKYVCKFLLMKYTFWWVDREKYKIKNKVHQILLNTREKNNAEMGIISCQ